MPCEQFNAFFYPFVYVREFPVLRCDFIVIAVYRNINEVDAAFPELIAHLLAYRCPVCHCLDEEISFLAFFYQHHQAWKKRGLAASEFYDPEAASFKSIKPD